MKTALLILVFNSMVFAQGVSLGDAARQERARQKNSPGNVKITNETLGTAEALSPSEEPVKVETESLKPVDANPVPRTDGTRDETAWRNAFKQARDEAKRAEDRTQMLQLELNKLNMDLLTRSDIYNREGQLAPVIDAKNKELAASEKAVIDAREKINQLEDELRRSGDPIGWSR